MIDIKRLRELVKLMVQNDLTELDVQEGSERVTLKRGPGDQPMVHYLPSPAPAAAQPAPGGSAAAGPSGATGGGADAGLIAIESPMVGTFYPASSPDAPPYINVGDRIGPDSVVCIVEAMKVFNEIRAEISGTVEKVLVDSGQAVEFGQALFMVRPG